MTKDEFLIRLRTLIAAMPKEERDDVMQYYSDYFEDAGPGKEQEVIRQLESPEAVASQVMGGTLPGGQEAQDRDQGGPAYGAPAQGQQRHRNGLRSWWGVLLAICAAPIALPLAIAGAAVLVILALAALLVIGSLILSAGAIAVMGGATVLYFMGSGLACLALGLLAAILLVKLAGLCFRGMANWGMRIVERRRGQQ